MKKLDLSRDNIEETLHGSEFYCITAADSSMLPEINPGDDCICDCNAIIQNGDLVHCKIDGESLIRVYFRDIDKKIVQFIPIDAKAYSTLSIELSKIIEMNIEFHKIISVSKKLNIA
ncbi:S24 family peptidase [Sulfurospirillum sp. 1612]|uniref:S24 family peptidase n=1 Tax=Sulfurospirillum sp. 1612 TaxID=3094835 RepID=UPI002F924BBB